FTGGDNQPNFAAPSEIVEVEPADLLQLKAGQDDAELPEDRRLGAVGRVHDVGRLDRNGGDECFQHVGHADQTGAQVQVDVGRRRIGMGQKGEIAVGQQHHAAVAEP